MVTEPRLGELLGLGAQPPALEWGLMLTNGQAFLINAPWAMIVPGLAIVITTLALNLAGDGVGDDIQVRSTT